MITCVRCGATFACAMADGGTEPCWCTRLPPVAALPPAGADAGCWCPACLEEHIAHRARAARDTTQDASPDA